MGAGALPSALLNFAAQPTDAGRGATGGDELERLRLENETLSAVVGVVAGGPDLPHILDRVVDLLTRATDCHACFVYLRAGGQLEMRAASPIYSHLVGRISFGEDRGLAGWAMRNGEAAFIREGAIEDARTHYVPELEEERFQSMVAVPIPARDGASIGALVLHTAAPREFDEGIQNVLSRAASLVAGAIENARLYEDAKERVAALTRLSGFGREVAAVGDRGALYELAARGIRPLIETDLVRVYATEGSGGLTRVAAEPADGSRADEGPLVEAFFEDAGLVDGPLRRRLLNALGVDATGVALDGVELRADGARVGAIVVATRRPWAETTPELFRAAAQQVALALEKIALIEHLTEENLARDLFDNLADGAHESAAAKVDQAGLADGRPRFLIVAEAPMSAGGPLANAADLERRLRASLPHALCDLSSGGLRALISVDGGGPAAVRSQLEKLDATGVLESFAVGASEARSGVDGLAIALREAIDAAKVAGRLGRLGRAMLYRDTGAYRYLIEILDDGGPRDHLRDAVDALAAYDRERNAKLLPTLDEYLSNGRSFAATARLLFVHVNTLRQRLDRIEELTGLTIADEDLLALQLAVKLGRVRD